MADSIINLYPPIVQDIQPAFIKNQTLKIYFSFSEYNTIDDIKNIQVSIISTKTNRSPLNKTLYPSGIKLIQKSEILLSENQNDDFNYYIEITTANLTEGQYQEDASFIGGHFYRVQLRFTSNQASNDINNFETWLFDNSQYFSEWSKTCLIKAITHPTVKVNPLSSMDGNAFELRGPAIRITGTFGFGNNTEKQAEYLNSYNIKIYNSNNLVYSSGEIYTDNYNPNEFIYDLSYDFLEDQTYIIYFTYTTNNLYTETLNYQFVATFPSRDSSVITSIIPVPNEEWGYIKVQIGLSETPWFPTPPNPSIPIELVIRRSSSEDNFQKIDIVKRIRVQNGLKKYAWYDTIIQNGIWYKYYVQYVAREPNQISIIDQSIPMACFFEDAFLTTGKQQLKIKFNPTVTGFKYNTTETQQVTIGSKFPFIKRNGNNYYRTFNLGGLIASAMDWVNDDLYIDEEDPLENLVPSDVENTQGLRPIDYFPDEYNESIFVNNPNDPLLYQNISGLSGEDKVINFSLQKDIYATDTIEQMYRTYNDQHKINKYNDSYLERKFRNKVCEFLYNDEVKLFRSQTEGNILVKLTNINLEPMAQLGRRLYSFSATATQIADATQENYDKYNIVQ